VEIQKLFTGDFPISILVIFVVIVGERLVVIISRIDIVDDHF
jgi:hypothetical protein